MDKHLIKNLGLCYKKEQRWAPFTCSVKLALEKLTNLFQPSSCVDVKVKVLWNLEQIGHLVNIHTVLCQKRTKAVKAAAF